MKAGVTHGKDDIRYEEIEKPIPKAGEVLIKVKYTGICGSDVPRVNGDASHFFPNVFGHEFAGTITEVGEGVEQLKVGDRVAGVPLVPCKVCDDCQKGNYALCKHYSFIGSRQFGSFAEYVAVPEGNAVKFSEDVTFEQGAFFEPSTVALHGLERLPTCQDKTVAILGGGTIGMFTMQWAKIKGAKKVVVFDIVNERLELGRKLGANGGINTLDADFEAQVKEATGGAGFDCVYETAGNTITMKMALALAANQGGICFIGTPTREMTFSIHEWEQINRKELTLTGSWMSYSAPFPGHEWEMTAHHFAQGDLKFDDSFVYEKVPLSRIDTAFAQFKVPGQVKGKILIDSES